MLKIVFLVIAALIVFKLATCIVANTVDIGVDVTLNGDGILISNSGEMLEGVVLTINDKCRVSLGSIAPGKHAYSKEELHTLAGCSWADAEVVKSIVLTATRTGSPVNLHAMFETAGSR